MSRNYLMIGGALVLGLVVLIGGTAYALRDDIEYAHLATGYAALQTCSCLHVSGRSLESCLSDAPEEARRQLSVVPDGESVKASVLFGAIHAEAHYDEGFGCRMLD